MGFQRVTCDKKTTLYNFYVSGFTTFFEQHRANRSLRESRKNLALCKLKLFRSAGQDNRRISDCADFIIRIHGGADGVVLHLRAGMPAPLIRGQDVPRAIVLTVSPPQRPTARAVSSIGTCPP